MKTLLLFFLLLTATASAQNNSSSHSAAIDNTLNEWHAAAAAADFNKYFGLMAPDARFIGTDATENWTIQEFKDFAKPYFDRGAAWDFQPVQRTIYVDSSQRIAWFDELVSGWMKLCRGSGIMELIDGQWKIKHYVLSMTIPNANANDVIKIKQPLEDELLKTLGSK